MAEIDFRSRIVGHGEEAPDQLLANPANFRIHPKAQQDALAGVLKEVGYVQSVVVNQITGHLIDGHLRVSLALRENQATIPVVYVELTPAEEALVLATFDPISGLAVTDKEKLTELLQEVSTSSAEIESLLTQLSVSPDGMSTEEKFDEWGGMPEFTNDNLQGYRSLIVHFDKPEDFDAFAKLIGQDLSPKAKAIWYPKQERISHMSMKYESDAE